MLTKIAASAAVVALATGAQAKVGDVFYIPMENHNWTQTAAVTGINQIYGNPAAPFINSLVTPGNPNAALVSYASNYQNVTPGLHPSEPNYVWQESGVSGVLNDADPYPANIVNAPSLRATLQARGISWKSYQEDTDLVNTLGNNINGQHGSGVAPTDAVVPLSQYEVPLTRFSGTSATYTNAYNGSHQYNYAPKHEGALFFTATNGGNDPTPANPEAGNYAPLQQLATDLANNTVARYNWITPDQYNDMHTPLNTDFTYHGVTYAGLTTCGGDFTCADNNSIALGDNFLSKIVPLIMSSQAFQNNGEIVIWNDETEGDQGLGSTAGITSMEIVISKLAKGNAYTNSLLYTHSNDLFTVQEILNVGDVALGGAVGVYSMGDLYKTGAIPEPASWAMMLAGFGLIGGALRRRLALGQAATV